MGLMAMLCRFVAKHMNLHAIPDRVDPTAIYIARYHTADKQENARWFLHNIKLPDNEPYAHNHPYRWQLSIILSASYTEEYFQECTCLGTMCTDYRHLNIKKRRIRFFNWIPSSRYHRITELHGDVWTIFVHGPKHGNSWYFWVEGVGKVHNELMERYWEWQSRTQAKSSETSLLN